MVGNRYGLNSGGGLLLLLFQGQKLFAIDSFCGSGSLFFVDKGSEGGSVGKGSVGNSSGSCVAGGSFTGSDVLIVLVALNSSGSVLFDWPWSSSS